MGEAFLDGCLSPGEVPLPLGRTALHGRGVLDEAFGGVFATIEDDVLDALEQCRLDVLVDGELAGVDDAHVEARADRVIEEDRVHRLAHRVVAAKGEAEVRDPARDLHAGAARLDLRDGGDERVRELRVLLDPRRDGEHVRVEDDVLGLPAVSRRGACRRARRCRPCAPRCRPDPFRRTPSRSPRRRNA